MESRHLRFGGKKTLHKLEATRKKLALYETSQTQRNLLFLKQKYASRSPRFLRWLKWRASKVVSSNFITSIKSRKNSIVTHPKSILSEFYSFYKQLYSSSNPSMEDINEYLSRSGFQTRLSQEHKDLLDAPISQIEVSNTIKHLKLNKAPGKDGLPSEFYKCFQHLLLPKLTNLCNDLLLTGNIPKSWLEAHIIVISKKDKDPTLVGSYRPISLLNTD